MTEPGAAAADARGADCYRGHKLEVPRGQQAAFPRWLRRRASAHYFERGEGLRLTPCRIRPKARQSLPTGAVSHDHDRLAVNVAIGNHRYTYGIGEILYTLKAFFLRLSSSYEVTYSIDLKPGVTNVLIDEFSLLETIGFLQKFKKLIQARNL